MSLPFKVLLVGPYPPPHGGISVHVAVARAELDRAGVECRVLNIARDAPPGGRYIRAGSAARLLAVMVRHARAGWTIHVHTNGHNLKSWAIALLGGLAARAGCGGLLTLHSGLAPAWLRGGPRHGRWLARWTCALYDRIIAVSPAIRNAVASLSVFPERLKVLPAFLPARADRGALPPELSEWISERAPLLATAIFFRPEYGFDLLLGALAALRVRHPRLGCLVMGSGAPAAEAEARAWIRRAGLEENVLLLGDVPHAACLALMQTAGVFVRPTREDGDATSVREALALGTPVVASNVGNRPDEAVLFKAGAVEDLAAKLAAVLDRQAASGVKLGFAHAKASRSDQTVARLLGIYHGVAESRTGRPRRAAA